MVSAKILIVEDEFLIGMELEHSLQDRGYDVIGVAVDFDSAQTLVPLNPDVALVDVNLRDGPTGPAIAQQLATQAGTSVVFVTANPRQISIAIPGAIGIVAKPADHQLISAAVDYAVAVRSGSAATPPPGLTALAPDQAAIASDNDLTGIHASNRNPDRSNELSILPPS